MIDSFFGMEEIAVAACLTGFCGSVTLCAMQERRSAPRIGFNLRVKVIQKEGQAVELIRANLSWGGLGGYTRDPIQDGESVTTEVFFVNRGGETIPEKISGKVIWAHRDGNFNAFGIAFSGLTAGSHPQLVSYLQYTDQFD